MPNENLIFKRGLQEDLDNVDIQSGQLLFTTDSGKIFMDFTDSNDNEIRTQIAGNPIDNKLYYGPIISDVNDGDETIRYYIYPDKTKSQVPPLQDGDIFVIQTGDVTSSFNYSQYSSTISYTTDDEHEDPVYDEINKSLENFVLPSYSHVVLKYHSEDSTEPGFSYFPCWGYIGTLEGDRELIIKLDDSDNSNVYNDVWDTYLAAPDQAQSQSIKVSAHDDRIINIITHVPVIANYTSVYLSSLGINLMVLIQIKFQHHYLNIN